MEIYTFTNNLVMAVGNTPSANIAENLFTHINNKYDKDKTALKDICKNSIRFR